jgi:hypothetical protein
MTIENRLEALEQMARDGARQARRWRVLATGLSMALLTMICVAADEPSHPVAEVVRARTFEVVGDNGAVLARLGQVNGDGGLALYGDDGKLEAVIGMTPDGAVVSLLNRKNELVRLVSAADILEAKAAEDAKWVVYPSRDPIED